MWRGQTERRKREIEDLLVLPRAAESLQNDAGFSGKIRKTRLTEKERVTSAIQNE